MGKKENWYESEDDNRPFFKALVYERDGDLNLAWLLVLLMGLAGIIGFIWVIMIANASLPVQIAGWTFLGSAFVSVLIAAIPIAKAKILANSRLPGEVAKSIAEAGKSNVEISTDIMELSRSKHNNIG